MKCNEHTEMHEMLQLQCVKKCYNNCLVRTQAVCAKSFPPQSFTGLSARIGQQLTVTVMQSLVHLAARFGSIMFVFLTYEHRESS